MWNCWIDNLNTSSVKIRFGFSQPNTLATQIWTPILTTASLADCIVFHLKFGKSEFPRTQMTKKPRWNICASAYLELRRVKRLSSRRSPVRELGKRAAPRFALDFESAFLVSSKARRFFSSSRSRAPDFQVQGAAASTDGGTDARSRNGRRNQLKNGWS